MNKIYFLTFFIFILFFNNLVGAETNLKNIVLGKFDYKKQENFVKISPEHSSKEIFLQEKTYEAFQKMYAAAKQEKINLKIISGTRSFYEQKSIWENKWQKYTNQGMQNKLAIAKKILEFSSMPGTSRHHWGTDIDINNLNNSYFSSGQGLKEYQWLVKNAAKYGFHQVYTDKSINKRTGYEMEKWHWSYLPIASKYLDYYNQEIKTEDINMFTGSDLANKLEIIKNYVNGISH